MKDGGALRVRVACGPDDEVQLHVADTGTGIPPAKLAQVFDPFFTTKEAGTGLGLSIVRKIVDQHRGEVHIESESGVGTRVTVTLPRGTATGSDSAVALPTYSQSWSLFRMSPAVMWPRRSLSGSCSTVG